MKHEAKQTCPLCGSSKIEAVVADISFRIPVRRPGGYKTETLAIPSVERTQCRDCGEAFFGYQARLKIEAAASAEGWRQ
jgi:hypothetical protein